MDFPSCHTCSQTAAPLHWISYKPRITVPTTRNTTSIASKVAAPSCFPLAEMTGLRPGDRGGNDTHLLGQQDDDADAGQVAEHREPHPPRKCRVPVCTPSLDALADSGPPEHYGRRGCEDVRGKRQPGVH